jgi:hypothetical protein
MSGLCHAVKQSSWRVIFLKSRPIRADEKMRAKRLMQTNETANDTIESNEHQSRLSSTAYQRHNSGAAAASPRAATNCIDSSSVVGGIAMPEKLSDAPLAKEYCNASFGPIIEGHYTEF